MRFNRFLVASDSLELPTGGDGDLRIKEGKASSEFLAFMFAKVRRSSSNVCEACDSATCASDLSGSFSLRKADEPSSSFSLRTLNV